MAVWSALPWALTPGPAAELTGLRGGLDQYTRAVRRRDEGRWSVGRAQSPSVLTHSSQTGRTASHPADTAPVTRVAHLRQRGCRGAPVGAPTRTAAR